jgi:DNA invertase Pin-like site-specific DNA recombinase
MKKKKLTNQTSPLITPDHLRRLAVVYVRQSRETQVRENTGSTEFQRSLAEVARSYGWPDSQIEIIEDDLGKSGYSTEGRTGWERLQEMIKAGQVGVVFVANISRLSRQVMEFELFRLRAALHNTLLYADGRFIDLAGASDRILSELVSIRDRWVATQKARAGKRHAAMSRRRSARAKKLPRSVRGQNSGRGKKR